MGKDPVAPFVAGQKAEARSFERGFRSAWFRCEVKEICLTKGKLRAFVDYFDFTEQEPEWLFLYQDPPYPIKSKDKKKTLMLRPEYPVICQRKQIADVNTLQEVVLVVNGHWKVGDMVDWFTDDCYWSGIITEILGTESAKIELIRPPVGEGDCYDVKVKDLRPTLDWSTESGWTVPISEDREEPCCCARLIHPTRQVSHIEESTGRPPNEGFFDGILGEASSEKRKSHNEVLTERPPDKGCSYGNIGEAFVDNRTFEGLDTLEAAVLGLEELLNKVKWLKRHMKDAIPLSESGGPSWEFVEHRG